jgi:hypothetical protein
MLWFQRFFEADGKESYVLRDNPECYDDLLEQDDVEESPVWQEPRSEKSLSAAQV